jgi:hypothetical protein
MIRKPFRHKWQYGLKTNFHGCNLTRRARLSRATGTKMPKQAMLSFAKLRPGKQRIKSSDEWWVTSNYNELSRSLATATLLK